MTQELVKEPIDIILPNKNFIGGSQVSGTNQILSSTFTFDLM